MQGKEFKWATPFYGVLWQGGDFLYEHSPQRVNYKTTKLSISVDNQPFEFQRIDSGQAQLIDAEELGRMCQTGDCVMMAHLFAVNTLREFIFLHWNCKVC